MTRDRIEQFEQAKRTGVTILDHDNTDQLEKYGTIGAVARDKQGNLAAATSTGGMVNKKWGRVGG